MADTAPKPEQSLWDQATIKYLVDGTYFSAAELDLRQRLIRIEELVQRIASRLGLAAVDGSQPK